MSASELRVGVDVGGTFTDVIAHDTGSGRILVGKTTTSSRDLASGVLQALRTTLGQQSLTALSSVSHGTTVGLNAILQERGATVGLLCTQGFRDVIEIRRGTHEDAFDVLWKPRAPLVRRALRLPVRERIRADGTVKLPLHEEDVERAVETFRAEAVESVAVAFINAWANPSHEVRVGLLLRELGYDGEITLAHELSGEYREYERTSTAVVNAYIRPLVSRYLRHLGASLQKENFNGGAFIMRSGGGAMTMREAEERPVEAIFSGPVAGAEAAAQVARTLQLTTAIAADVGGTSFDTTLIVDGAAPLLSEGRVADAPVQASWVDVRSIGAGGGSIAYVDIGGLLRVGPESAGSNPGPAAYGRGGDRPTVTDAATFLGMLVPGALGDNVRLDVSLAERALQPLAKQLGMGIEQVARGIVLISTAAMADAIREITIERGHDAREAALIAFGGAGPLFATLLARELETPTVVIPPAAGNFSAWGLLGADVVRESARTYVAPINEDTLARADSLLTELFRELTSRTGLEGAEEEAYADLRYRGQEHPMTLRLDRDDEGLKVSPTDLNHAFNDCYADVYLHRLEHDVEIVAVRATLRRRAALPQWPLHQTTKRSGIRKQQAFSFAVKEHLAFSVVERDSLPKGELLLGPAIVVEPTTTTYVDADFAASVDESGFLILERREQTA